MEPDISPKILTEQFYNISGNTLAERRRSFVQYQSQVHTFKNSASELALDEFAVALKPRNKLENVYHVELLLQCQHLPSLWKIYFSHDVHLWRKVLKSKWFVNTAFKEISAEDLVLEVLRKVSFAKRICTLNRLERCLTDDNERIDAYYNEVKKAYGLHIAKRLLTGCDHDILLREMEHNRIVLTCPQVLTIYKRRNDFVATYFRHLRRHGVNDFTRYISVIKYLATKDPQTYWTLLKEFNLHNCKLSQLGSQRIMQHFAAEIIHNSSKYISAFNRKYLTNSLNDNEFKVFYTNLFPKYFEQLSADLLSDGSKDLIYLLNRRSEKSRFDTFDSVFIEIYGSSICQYDELITEELLKMIPIERRDDIIAKKIQAHDDVAKMHDWECFYDANKAIDIFKTRIAGTAEPTNRHRMIIQMVKTCILNKDFGAMLSVLHYFAERHRNEDFTLFRSLLDYLERNCSPIMEAKFTAELWAVISAISALFKIKFSNKYCSALRIFSEAHIRFLIRNGDQVGTRTALLCEFREEHRNYQSIPFHHKKVSKAYLEVVPEFIRNPFEGMDHDRAVFHYIKLSQLWNEKCKRTQRIDVLQHDFVRTFILKTMSAANDDATDHRYFTKQQLELVLPDHELRTLIYDAIWIEGNESHDHPWMFFLKHAPEYIVKYYDMLFHDCYLNRSEGYEKFVRQTKMYSHLNIPKLLTAKAKQVLSEPLNPDIDEAKHAVKVALLTLSMSDSFNLAIEPFIKEPDSWRQIKTDDTQHLYEIRKSIAEILGERFSDEQTIVHLSKFLHSDYLPVALRSLYKIAYNLPPNNSQLKTLIAAILNSNKVSLRKHAIFITCATSNQNDIMTTLINMGHNEKHQSVRKYLLKSALNYFNENAKEELLDRIIFDIIVRIDKDAEMLDMLADFTKVPGHYFSIQVNCLWRLIEGDKSAHIQKLRFKILQNVADRLSHNKFDCNFLLSDCLDFTNKNAEPSFASIYKMIIFDQQVESPHHLKTVFTSLRAVRNQFASYTNPIVRRNVTQFYRGFFRFMFKLNSSQANSKTMEIVDEFCLEWSTFSSRYSDSDAFMYRSIAVLFLKHYEHDKHKFMEDFLDLYDYMVSDCMFYDIGTYSFIMVAENFRTCCTDYASAVEDSAELIMLNIGEEILNTEKIGINHREMFALHLLPHVMPKSMQYREKLHAIMQKLSTSKNMSLVSLLNRYAIKL